MGGRGVAKGVGKPGAKGRAGGGRPTSSAEGAARPERTPPETLFLATIPGATPSTWVSRFTSRERSVQLVNHDEAVQAAHLRHDAVGMPVHPLPQLGYLRWRRDGAPEDVLRAAGVDPRHVHVVRAYSELPVVCVGKDHLLAAWDLEADGPVPWDELDPEDAMDPARFAAEADPEANPLDSAEVPGTGERTALEIVASGAGHVVLPQSVARMFGRKDVVVLPVASELDETVGMSRADREAAATQAEVAAEEAGEDVDRGDSTDEHDADAGVGLVDRAEGDGDAARHPGWDVGLAWLKEVDSDLVQAFVGVARGRRSGSSR